MGGWGFTAQGNDEDLETNYGDYDSNPDFKAKDEQSNGEDFEGNFEDEEANTDYRLQQ